MCSQSAVVIVRIEIFILPERSYREKGRIPWYLKNKEQSATGEGGKLWTHAECRGRVRGCWSCCEGHTAGGETVRLSDGQGQLEGSDVPG